jgi:hypothetical protein
MTMNGAEPKTTEKPTTPTPSRGESAVRHLYKRAVEEDRKEDAKLISTVANLLDPSIKLTSGLPVPEAKTKPEKATVNTAQIDGAEVDISAMADDDAADYLQYTREMDGSARRERHVEQLEREDAEMLEIRRQNGG